jgi:hypothetical protein
MQPRIAVAGRWLPFSAACVAASASWFPRLVACERIAVA